MVERFADDLPRELIEAIEARLREAQRLRNRADHRYREAPFWTDRPGIGRVTDDSHGEEESPAA